MTFGYGIRYAPLMLGGASAERTLLVLLGFTVAASAHAESQTSSQPQDPQAAGSQPQTQRQQTAILWYRSTEGCPSGPDFLVRLGDRSRSVRLAQAGDRVDFVVNLAQGSDGARGQLERETGRGTVAIREVADASCERVAEVLALNLALALDPEAMASEIPAEPAALEQTEDARKEQTISAQPPSHNEPRVLPVAKQAQGDSTHPPDQEERPSVGLRLGMQGGILTGVAARGMGRGTAFFEVSSLFGSVLPDLTMRVAVVGAWGASDTTSGVIRQSLWAGRFELCPVAWGSAQLSIAPCAAGEVGQLRAAGPVDDSALWVALDAHARGRWVVVDPLALEVDAGTTFPLTRYTVAAGSTPLYHSSPVGFSASLGASFAF